MNTFELHDYLRREVEDLLGAGRVGIYEFVDLLRDQPGLAEAEMQAISFEVLSRMINSGTVVLKWQRWGETSFEEDATGVVPRLADWATPTSEPYLVVVSAGRAR